MAICSSSSSGMSWKIGILQPACVQRGLLELGSRATLAESHAPRRRPIFYRSRPPPADAGPAHDDRGRQTSTSMNASTGTANAKNVSAASRRPRAGTAPGSPGRRWWPWRAGVRSSAQAPPRPSHRRGELPRAWEITLHPALAGEQHASAHRRDHRAGGVEHVIDCRDLVADEVRGRERAEGRERAGPVRSSNGWASSTTSSLLSSAAANKGSHALRPAAALSPKAAQMLVTSTAARRDGSPMDVGAGSG